MFSKLVGSLVPEGVGVAVNGINLIRLIGQTALKVPPMEVEEAYQLKEALNGVATKAQKAAFVKEILEVEALQQWIERGYLPTTYTKKDLESYGAGTLGEAFCQMLDKYGLDVQIFPDFEIKNELDYFEMRGQQTHDFWHLISGFPQTALGEFGLIGFYMGNFKKHFGTVGERMITFSNIVLAVQLIEFGLHMPGRLPEIYSVVWDGIQRGRNAESLLTLDWEEMWEQPIHKIRSDLKVEIPEREPLEGQVGRKAHLAS